MSKSKREPIGEIISFSLDGFSVEFMDGGKARIRIWDPEKDVLSTYDLSLSKAQQWDMKTRSEALPNASHIHAH